MEEAAKAAKRDAILKLLTDAENAKVSSAEDGKSLAADDSFVDLENLDKGIQQGALRVRSVMSYRRVR